MGESRVSDLIRTLFDQLSQLALAVVVAKSSNELTTTRNLGRAAALFIQEISHGTPAASL